MSVALRERLYSLIDHARSRETVEGAPQLELNLLVFQPIPYSEVRNTLLEKEANDVSLGRIYMVAEEDGKDRTLSFLKCPHITPSSLESHEDVHYRHQAIQHLDSTFFLHGVLPKDLTHLMHSSYDRSQNKKQHILTHQDFVSVEAPSLYQPHLLDPTVYPGFHEKKRIIAVSTSDIMQLLGEQEERGDTPERYIVIDGRKYRLEQSLSEKDRRPIRSLLFQAVSQYEANLRQAVQEDNSTSQTHLWQSLQRIQLRRDTLWIKKTNQQEDMLIFQILPPLGQMDEAEIAIADLMPEALRKFKGFLFESFGVSTWQGLLWKMELYRDVAASSHLADVYKRWKSWIYYTYEQRYGISWEDVGEAFVGVDRFLGRIAEAIAGSERYAAIAHRTEFGQADAAGVAQLDEHILNMAGFSPMRGRHVEFVNSMQELHRIPLSEVKRILRASPHQNTWGGVGGGQPVDPKAAFDSARKLTLMPLMAEATAYHRQKMRQSTIRQRQLMEYAVYARRLYGEIHGVSYLLKSKDGSFRLSDHKEFAPQWYPPQEVTVIQTGLADFMPEEYRHIPVRLCITQRDKLLEDLLRKFLERETFEQIKDMFGRYIIIDTDSVRPYFEYSTGFGKAVDTKKMDEWARHVAYTLEEQLKRGADEFGVIYNILDEPGKRRKDRLRGEQVERSSGGTDEGTLAGSLKFYQDVHAEGEEEVEEEVWIMAGWSPYVAKTIDDERFFVERLRNVLPGKALYPVLFLLFPYVKKYYRKLYEDIMRRPERKKETSLTKRFHVLFQRRRKY